MNMSRIFFYKLTVIVKSARHGLLNHCNAAYRCHAHSEG